MSDVVILIDSLVCPFCGADTMHGSFDHETGEHSYECIACGGGSPRDGAYPDDFICDESRAHCLTQWVIEPRVIRELAPAYRERAIEALIAKEDEEATP